MDRESGGYSRWGHKESDMTEHTHAHKHTHTHTHTHTHICMYNTVFIKEKIVNK